MYKISLVLIALLVSGCTSLKLQSRSPSSSTPMSSANANGSIKWASGTNEKFYMSDSRNTISFISSDGLVIFQRARYITNGSCDMFYKEEARVKICEDGEAILYKNGQMINTGFVDLYHGY